MFGNLFGKAPKENKPFDWVNDFPPHWEHVASADRTMGSSEKIYIDAGACFAVNQTSFGKIRVETTLNGSVDQMYLLVIIDASDAKRTWHVVEALIQAPHGLVKGKLDFALEGIPEMETAITAIHGYAKLLNYKHMPPYVGYVLQNF